jgi:hypothetical protein
VPLPSVGDYAALKQHLLAALGAIAGEYIPTNPAADNAPQVHLRLNNGRMEALIRYPINYRQAADIDERVAQAVLQALAEPPAPAAS